MSIIPVQPTCFVLSVLGALLSYPGTETLAALPEARARLLGTRLVEDAIAVRLEHFLDYLQGHDLLTLQENYVELFDRGRSTSLYLFEHVHGESRERGQAMVDLLQCYEARGLSLKANELPDYLPVFLEYLSRLPQEQAISTLAETGEILRSLTNALIERKSHYRLLLEMLLVLAGLPVAPATAEALHDEADVPPSAADYREIDADYVEEPVDLRAPPITARPGTPRAEPIHFHDKRPPH